MQFLCRCEPPPAHGNGIRFGTGSRRKPEGFAAEGAGEVNRLSVGEVLRGDGAVTRSEENESN